MKRVAPPPPVSFELSARDVAEVRKELAPYPNGYLSWIFAFNFIIGEANGILRLSSKGSHHTLAWLFIGSYAVLLALVYVAPLLRLIGIKPGIDMTISFDEDGIGLVRRSRTMILAYARIARVRILPNALAIEPNWSPAIALPLRALPEDGARLIEFFEDRLVSKLLFWRSSARTVIVNTARR